MTTTKQYDFLNRLTSISSGIAGTAIGNPCTCNNANQRIRSTLGRQLGYPLELVTTKGHLFVRWEGGGGRFNIEATGRGVNRLEDDYYRHWPFEVSAAEEAAEGYLRPLNPAQELAVFLSIRGMCLRDSGRLADATESFAAASRLSPGTRSYEQMAVALGLKPGTESRSAGDKSASIQCDASHSKL